MKMILLTMTILAIACPTIAASNPTHHLTAAGHDTAGGPVVSSDGKWVVEVLIIVAGLFIAAAVIGPIYRASLPEELPLTHSHDEPPGSSGHHGHSGAVDHSAPEKHGH